MRVARVLAAALLFALPGVAAAAPPSAVPERLTLPNGLRVVLAPDPGHATAAICTTFRAGPQYDGQYGGELARAVAETLREGGRRAGSAEYSRIMRGRGAWAEIDVQPALVQFCSSVPAQEFELGLWLESGRHLAHAFTEENFRERLRDLSAEDEESPRRRLRRLTLALADPARGLGPLAAASFGVEEARAFHARYYTLERAALSITGGFDATNARQALLARFAGAPRSTEPAPAEPPTPRQTSPRFASLEEPALRSPLYEQAWVVAGRSDAERIALELGARVLAGGESGLVATSFSAAGLSVEVSYEIAARPSWDLFGIVVQTSRPTLPGDAERHVDEAITRLRVGGPSAAELERARQAALTTLAFAWESSLERARWLGQRLATDGSLDRRELVERYAAVTRDDVKRVLSAALIDSRRITAELHPVEARSAVVPARIHLVAPGDNLSRIAARYGTTVAALAAANDLRPKTTLRPGQKLKLPSGSKPERVHVVKAGDTLIGIGKRYGVRADEIAAKNGLSPKRLLRIGQKLRLPR